MSAFAAMWSPFDRSVLAFPLQAGHHHRYAPHLRRRLVKAGASSMMVTGRIVKSATKLVKSV